MAVENNEDFWNQIIQKIEEEKCILILGPEAAIDNSESINAQLKELIERNVERKFKYYYHEDEFFSFENIKNKEDAYYDLRKLYNELPVQDIYSKIAKIPFHLIISLSPDLILKKEFENNKIDFLFDFYNKEQNPRPIGKFTKEKPLIYNLFGNINEEGSLILTYDDLFDYIFAILGKYQLNNDLKSELKKARVILFIGFNYEKWYFKLICRLLNLKDKVNHAPLNDRNILLDVKNFYSDELKVEFLNYSSSDIINSIYQKCLEKQIIRTKPNNTNTEKPEIFISYAWSNENERIVDIIYRVLNENQFKVTLDKVDLGYKGDIKKFMQKIGKGKYIVVILCNKYLKSKNCMNEMLEIIKNGEVQENTFPIVMDNAKLHDNNERISYINSWDNEIQKLYDSFKTIKNPIGTDYIIEKINLYNDIRRMLDYIIEMFSSMIYFKAEVLIETNFKPLIEAIKQKSDHDRNKMKKDE